MMKGWKDEEEEKEDVEEEEEEEEMIFQKFECIRHFPISTHPHSCSVGTQITDLLACHS